MRNLKRALSLTLASVMLLGMMVVGSSAAAGYDDVSKTDNVEAIEVLQAIEVMVGDERGFGPERPVNRAEMAVVMGKLLNLDYNYYSTSCPFDDVYDWARGYVGACYANKIVSGRGEGVYDPGATVTAVEAASMLMRALGYFQYSNDVADGFELSTVREGNKIGIFDQVGSSATEPMTRNQVAQMVLNALRSGVVEPDGNTINLTTPDGTVYTGRVNYVYVTSNKPFARAIGKVGATSVGSTNDGSIVELGERLYDGKLKLDEYATDAFQRPSRHWEYDGKDIGTYMKKELLRQEYTQKVTGKMLYDLLTKATIDDYDFTIAVDGETSEAVLKNSSAPNSGRTSAWFTKGNLVRTNTEAVGDTGDGVLTQVFVDPDEGDGTVYISIINTYLAKAVDDYNEKKDEATYKVWSLWDGDVSSTRVGLVKNTAQKIDLDVKGEDFDIEDVKKDDIVLVHVAEGEIKEIIDPEVIDETEISSFKRTDWVNADGTQYDYADTVQYDDDVLDWYDNSNMKDTTYRLYLDEYGYMIGIEILEDPNEYVFLTGIDLNTSNLSNKTADGFIINTDGIEATVKINMDKSRNAMGNKFNAGNNQYGTTWTGAAGGNKGTGVGSLMNTWCRFTVNSDGVYTLYEVPNTDATWGATETAQKANNSKGKAGQGRDHSETDAIADLLTLDKSHLYLSSEITAFKRVYTNDNTVFITAETDRIKQTNAWNGAGAKVENNTSETIIINGVDSVTTGAANVNLKAWNAKKVIEEGKTDYAGANPLYTSNGVYTLFDKDGYVIAAVVVGEDDGTTTSFAFVTSGNMEQEGYSKTDDIYTWTRKVIINGEEVILTEKTDTDPEIANMPNGKMSKGNWVEVKYKADGTVKSVTNLSTNPINYPMPTADFDNAYNDTITNNVWVGDKYIDSIAEVEAATDEKNTVLLWDNLVNENKYVSVEGSTLQIWTNNTTDKDGFGIAPDCKTVLIQDGAPTINDNKYMDSIQYYSGGSDGAKRAVDRLEKNHVFVGFIGAVLENGRATSIIIYDKSAYSINQGTSSVVSPTDYQTTINLQSDGMTLMVKAAHTQNGQGAEVRSAALNWLATNGYTPFSFNTSSSGTITTNNFEIMATKDGQIKYFRTDLTPVIILTVDGQKTAFEFTSVGAGDAPTNTADKTIDSATGYTTIVNSTAAGVEAGVAVSANDPYAFASGTGWTPQFAHDGWHVRTNAFQITVGGSPKWYQAGDKITLAGPNANFTTTADGTGKQLPVTNGELAVTSDMNQAGATLVGGQISVTATKTDGTKVTLYGTAGGSALTFATCGLVANEWVETNVGYVKITTANEFVIPAGTTSNIVISDVGYHEVKLTASGSGTKGIYTSFTTESKYVKSGDVEFTVTFTGSATASTTATVANAKWEATLPATVPANVTRTSDTVITADGSQTGGVDFGTGYTVKVVVESVSADVAATMTIA